MSTRKILFGSDARSMVKKGIDSVANPVKVTLGAKGRNVIIKDKGMPTRVTKDGVSTVKSIYFSDQFRSAGAELMKEAASNTHAAAGDGTSTSTVLAQAICSVGNIKYVNWKLSWKFPFIKKIVREPNPIDLKRGIDKAVLVVTEKLKSISLDIGYDNDKIKQVARISANNDNEIGDLIAEAMSKINEDGVVAVENSKSINTYVELVEGTKFDRGYISPYFINNEGGTCELENAKVLVTDRVLSTVKDIDKLGYVFQEGHPLLIIAEGVEGEALSTLVLNRMKKNLRLCIINAPGLGATKKDLLADIAIVVGAELISDSVGVNMENFTPEMLGECDKITVTSSSTTLIGGKGKREKIEQRISQLKTEKENEENEASSLVLRDRIARLVNGIAVLFIGASSEVEINEKRDRVDDALGATRAAISEGIVPGGGIAYIRCIDSLKGLEGYNNDETLGIDIVRKAIEAPFKQIIDNAGQDSSAILKEVRNGTGDYGYNVRTEKFENLIETGVIDPTKVTRVALENAASVAGMFLTAECIIVDDIEK